MSRSACLPDTSDLVGLLHGVRGPAIHAGLGAPASWTRRIKATSASAKSSQGEAEPTTPRVVISASGIDQLLNNLESELTASQALDERLAKFAPWLEVATEAKAVFISDTEGLALVESKAMESYIAAAGEVANVLDSLSKHLPNIEEGSTTLLLRDGDNVHLVWCETELGKLVVGLVLDRPLPPVWLAVIPAALRKVSATDKVQL